MARAEIIERGRPMLPLETSPMNQRQRRAAEAQEHRDERARTHTGGAVKRHAFTINEFCWSHGISRATYYNLKARDEAPDEMRVLGKVLITEAAAAKWRKQTAARSNTK